MTNLWAPLVRHPFRAVRHFGRQLIHGDFFDRAALLAFWLLLSLVPLLLCIVVIFGYLVSGLDLEDELPAFLNRVAPSQAVANLLSSVLAEIQQSRGSGKLSFGLLVALWSASSVISAIHRSIDFVVGGEKVRTLLRATLSAIPVTLLVALPWVASLGLLLFTRNTIDWVSETLGLELPFLKVLDSVRWPLLLLAVVVAFDLVFKTAPAIRRRRIGWLTPGGLLALGLWLAASRGFHFYVTHFAIYSKVYGSLGVIIVLLLWCYLTSLAILVGVQLNVSLLEVRKPPEAKAES